MSILRRATQSLKSFGSSQNGNTSVIFALAALPLFLAAGAGIDMARHVEAQTEIQTALDAGALAGAAAMGADTTERQDIAKETFAANLDERLKATNVSYELKDGVMHSSAQLEFPTSFMKLGGFNYTMVTARNEVNMNSSKKAEIALVLDYSGSMEESISGGVKYVAMRKAAIELVDDLAKLDDGKVKIGLVPFSHHVYLGLPSSHVLGQPATGSWTGCTVDRKFPMNTTSSTPGSNPDSKWGQAQHPVHADWGCNGYKNDGNGYKKHNLKVAALTTKLDGIKSQLASMTPYAWTHIALGAEFGYHLLTPNAPYAEGVPMDSKDVQKYLVLLTDGAQTEPGYGNGKQTVSNGEANLEAICANAKAEGIKVITMAFDLDDSSTRKRLKNCSSEDGNNFFVANSGAQLAKAFDSIRFQVAQNIFLNK